MIGKLRSFFPLNPLEKFSFLIVSHSLCSFTRNLNQKHILHVFILTLFYFPTSEIFYFTYIHINFSLKIITSALICNFSHCAFFNRLSSYVLQTMKIVQPNGNGTETLMNGTKQPSALWISPSNAFISSWNNQQWLCNVFQCSRLAMCLIPLVFLLFFHSMIFTTFVHQIFFIHNESL